MKIIKNITFREIKEYLKNEGNFDDNLLSLKGYNRYILAELSEEDFFNLCFLEITHTKPITLKGRDLRSVAECSISLLSRSKHDLGPNWDLKQIYEKSREHIDKHGADMHSICLKDASNNRYKYYIQDGNHRCLGLAMHLLKNTQHTYQPVRCFIATNQKLDI